MVTPKLLYQLGGPKLYVGKTVNSKDRFSKYFSINYLTSHKTKMPITAALLLYGYSNFHLYILELCENIISKQSCALSAGLLVSKN